MANENNHKMNTEQSEISQLILHWGYYRDNRMWEELKETFHPDGEISVTWYKGTFDGFVEASKDMAKRGAKSAHVMNPSIIDINKSRAIAITPVSIKARAKIALGVEVDMTSDAQFFDFVERREGEWRILKRICIYHQDRMDSVFPSLRFWLISFFLPTKKYNSSYMFLGLALENQGYDIKPNQITADSKESRNLYKEGRSWLYEDLEDAEDSF